MNHQKTLVIGILLGLVLGQLFFSPVFVKAESGSPAVSEEMEHQQLDKTIDQQQKIQKEIETLQTQIQFLKAAVGK